MKKENLKKLKNTREKFLKLSPFRNFDIAIVLGSGLGELNLIEVKKSIDFSEIGLKESTVQGHNSKFLIGKFEDKKVIIQSGRLHLYEGLEAFDVCLPVAIYGEVGVKEMIITNAAGGINDNFEPGDIMLISDHINLQGENILIEFCNDKDRFVDMSRAYSLEYYQFLKEKFNVKIGVYLGLKGPSFETPAEIKAFERLGGDAVGMSTVQEVILAKYFGMKVTGLSLITNMASGKQKQISHEEVLNIGRVANEKMAGVIRKILTELGETQCF